MAIETRVGILHLEFHERCFVDNLVHIEFCAKARGSGYFLQYPGENISIIPVLVKKSLVIFFELAGLLL